jgi:hypothetical protein
MSSLHVINFAGSLFVEGIEVGNLGLQQGQKS